MKITFYSLLMSLLWSSLMILITHFLRKKPFFLRKVGAPLLLVFYMLSIGRMVFPVEFPFVQEISLRNWYSQFMESFYLNENTWANVRLSWAELAGLCWGTVSLILLLVFSIRYCISLKKLPRFFSKKDVRAEKILDKIQQGRGKSFTVQIFRCTTTQVPVGIGLFKKKILLPEKHLSDKELCYILCHEYTHFLHKDLFLKMMTHLYCCVFWWNPLVYLLRKDVAQILEIKCDLAVTGEYSNLQKAEYLQTIVDLLKNGKKEALHCFPVAAGLLQSDNSLSLVERFKIVSGNVRPANNWVFALLLGSGCTLFASYLFVIQPAYDPPSSDIFTEADVTVPNLGDVYLLKHKDGTYCLISENEQPEHIENEAVINAFLQSNVPVIEE